MEHVAIMKKSFGLLPKILSGEKTIESRWYSQKRAPFGKIREGERIYFKNSGEPVSVVAKAGRVVEFENLDDGKIRELSRKYFREIGSSSEDALYSFAKGKRFAILIYLDNPLPCPSFEIDKRGFGNMAAWLSVGRISEIRKRI